MQPTNNAVEKISLPNEPLFTAQEGQALFRELFKTVHWQCTPAGLRKTSASCDRKEKVLFIARYGDKFIARHGDEKNHERVCGESSGIVLPWTEVLLDIKQYLEDKLDTRFRSAFLQLLVNEPDNRATEIAITFSTLYNSWSDDCTIIGVNEY